MRIGHSQESTTATVAIISTLLVVLIIIIGICVIVQVIYKLVNRKKRQAQLTHALYMYIYRSKYTVNTFV